MLPSKLTERKLTKSEVEKREDIINGMKQNKTKLVKRYGKEAEKVMYGKATKMAKDKIKDETKDKIQEMVRNVLSRQNPIKEQDIEVGADRYEGEDKLGSASAGLDDLKAKLSSHDWFHMMSDSHEVWEKGVQQKREIHSIIKDLEGLGYGDEAKELYNSVEPYTKAFPGSKHKLKEKKTIKEWGSSDTTALISHIHSNLGSPTSFPYLGDMLDAASEAVDFYWDDWEEYKTDREGLTIKAAQMYARRQFPEEFKKFQAFVAPAK